MERTRAPAGSLVTANARAPALSAHLARCTLHNATSFDPLIRGSTDSGPPDGMRIILFHLFNNNTLTHLRGTL